MSRTRSTQFLRLYIPEERAFEPVKPRPEWFVPGIRRVFLNGEVE